MNTTVHLFTPKRNKVEKSNDTKYKFFKTCYPAFLNGDEKGWCTTRRPGVFTDKNELPQPGSGWGFCSMDPSQEYCNGKEIKNFKLNGTPHKVTFFSPKHCLDQLEDNLKVDQPDNVKGFKEKVDRSETFCTGQIFEHSFENEKFVLKSNNFEDINGVNPTLEVIILVQVNIKCLEGVWGIK